MRTDGQAISPGAVPSVTRFDRTQSRLFAVRILPPALLGGALAIVYGLTIAPGLTWANGGADGGDLITAAVTGGIAHPTGYPVYLLLARLFQLLPIGTLAFRTNLLSAVATIGAALLVFATTKCALAAAGREEATSGGLVAGLVLGLAPLIWSQAVITEVYALKLFFIALLLYLLTALPATRSRLQNGLSGLVQGLAVGNQILSAVLVPATLLAVALQQAPARFPPWKGLRWNASALRDASLGLLAGLCTYADLPIRAVSQPAVNWGDAGRLQGFWWLVSGSLYQPELMQFSPTVIWQHLQGWASVTVRQFGVAGLATALSGPIVFFRPSRLHFLTLWIALVFSLFAVQYDVADAQVYLLPDYLAFSVWIGIGVGECVHLLNQRWSCTGWMLAAVCTIYFGVLGLQAWPRVDAARDSTAEAYGQGIMGKAPARAILFAQGDQTVFTLWYFHYALHERQDLAVIATDLLPFDWYRGNLQQTYPDLVVPSPGQEPWLLAVRNSNQGRPACYLDSRDSLLNCQ